MKESHSQPSRLVGKSVIESKGDWRVKCKNNVKGIAGIGYITLLMQLSSINLSCTRPRQRMQGLVLGILVSGSCLTFSKIITKEPVLHLCIL
jgi:hypothetical protein